MESDPGKSAQSTDWQHLDVATLESLVTSQAGLDSLVALRDQDAAAVMDVLEEALDAPDLENRCVKLYASILRKLCTACDTLPKSCRLTECVVMIGERPQAIGGFADVWLGSYCGHKVAVKVLKESESNLKRVKKRFFKEALLWKRLLHPHVLPFLGVANTPRGAFCLLSSWMPNGTLSDYIISHPQSNRLDMLSEVADGLEYLHGKDLVHGDLKGSNVLMNENFHAVLADFGLITIVSTGPVATLSTTGLGTCRWMAPELFFPEMYGLDHSIPSKESDVYAFGMVIYEVMTGSVPFKTYSEARVMKLILDGTRPKLPTSAVPASPSENIWQIAEDSWKQEPRERPAIRLIFQRVKQITQHWIPPSPVPEELYLEGDDESHLSVALSEIEMENERFPIYTTYGDPLRDNALNPLSPKFPSVDQQCSVETPLFNTPNSLATIPPINAGAVNPRKLDIQRILDENVISARKSLEMCPPGNVDRTESLYSLGIHLWKRFKETEMLEDIQEAIVCGRGVLELCPPGHAGRAESLHGLSIYLRKRYGKLGRTEDIEEAIACGREALELCPPGHVGRAESLRGLGISLRDQYNKLGRTEDIEEAIACGREALKLCPPGHVDRVVSLRELGISLQKRYDKLGRADVIDEAVVCQREALQGRPPGHVDRAASLLDLSLDLSRRYDELGRVEDIEEAIACQRESLELCPPGHVDRAISLQGLGILLLTRYGTLGRLEYIEEAILCERECLELCPPGHVDRAIVLQNLGVGLQKRYQKLGRMGDIEEAIVCGLESLRLRPPGHVDRAESLRDLAIYLSRRYDKARGLEDIEREIQLLRELLELCPPGHEWHVETLDDLVAKLYTLFGRIYTKVRSTKVANLEAIESAIRCGKESRDNYATADPRRLVLRYQLNILRSMRKQGVRGIQALTQ